MLKMPRPNRRLGQIVQMAQTAHQLGARSAVKTSMEAPTGGVNTRDSLDNMSPSDAITLDNWLPDVGAVRVRFGFNEHTDSDEQKDLLDDGGFETAGGGDPDFFQFWAENAGDGAIAQDAVVFRTGKSCKLTAGPSLDAYVTETEAVTASRNYRLTMWTRGDGTYAGRYRIYDNSNAADIVAVTSTAVTGTTWTKVVVDFDTPVACVEVLIYLYCPGTDTGIAWFDDCTLGHTPAAVQTLMEYTASGTTKIIAAEGGTLWDVTTAGSPTAVSTLCQFSVDKWQHVMHDNKLGMVNGTDTPQQYTHGGGLASLTVTGPTNPVGICSFKSRTYFWDANASSFWYSATNTLGGACTEYQLSRVAPLGGTIVAMTTWSRDGGAGPDDMLAIFLSGGECIVYSGSYPGSDADWGIVGRFEIGQLMSVRSTIKFGGDIYLATEYDHIKLSDVIAGLEARVEQSKISGYVTTAALLYRDYWGWQAVTWPEKKLLIMNVPIESDNSAYHQHVQNTITGAWCRFTGLVSHCWLASGGKLYFGSDDGKVNEYSDTSFDDNGTAINALMETAWTRLDFPEEKSFISIREFYSTDVDITMSNVYQSDFGKYPTNQYPAAVASGSTAWGSAWGSSWAGVFRVSTDWVGVGVFGEWVSMQKKTSTKQDVKYLGLAWLYDRSEAL
jgi:hypothetical protein